MLTLAYVAASDVDLATAWLQQTVAQGQKPVLVSDAADRPVLRALALRFGLEHHLLPGAPDWPEALALRPLLGRIAQGQAEAVFLCDPVPFNMVFRNNEVVPSWADRFPAVRVLHQLGVRDFRFIGRQGEYKAHIPWLLDSLVGRHRNQRAFIVGNGPSLRQTDMTKLKDEITFGSNRSFLGYEDWGYAFKYWGISDRLQIEMYREEYEQGIDRDSVKFFPFEYLPFFRVENACPIPVASEIFFGDTTPLRFPYFAERPSMVFMAFTVTITLIQIAAMMGCNPIILIGVDHSYPIARVKRRGQGETGLNPTALAPPEELARNSKLGWDFWEGNAATGATHFTDKYTSNKVFVPPRTAWSESAYDYCRLWGERYGVEILNATVGTHLESFPKVDYASLF
ncbi:motility associated factor glycosyltransferase family protein [Roseomonas marmotae]|uniref:DUF115 domain-containing protein n=1 Tax=Roseomonas marmotae TaxID=2768161 RepID=A0ABS3KEB0_9PROT|nr:hypothetical protein [Roseomonas marmotae]MBO1075806.1 hypothetical protein [Roseomonas marmotae]QTI80528.1 hypothetical protein IAI58_07270 [Roseomonas marmotae]